MGIEIHRLRYRELLRAADHYRLAPEAMKSKSAPQAATTRMRRPRRFRLPART
ncbi:hypothetical protein [Streptomyces sp. GS7]|uniref:hypothetical protein n=1 Tax=Streptomyces sp. GS7 TaxID=2692234 RepID=UPI00131688C3|nr:hypothetical protein [Streptomyces sp. GS7]QHC22855.1 hypothetical protein GR130_16860 [Streptomyces sp. GS7]